MKRVIFWTLAAAAGAASGAALADDDTGAFYVAPMLQYGVLDDHRAAKDDFAGDLAVGYNFAPHFSGEVNYSEGSFRIHDQQSQKLYAYTLDGMFKLLPSSIIDPYVLLGGGEMDDTVGRGNGTNHTWTAEGGLGALTGIGSQTGSFRVQLRTEAKYRRDVYDLVTLDYSLQDGNALDLLPRLKAIDAGVPILLLTANGSIELAVRSIQLGAEQFLVKPLNLPALLVVLDRTVENQRNRRKELANATRDQPRRSLDLFLGLSPAIRRMEEQAHRAASAESPILIQGETGTGKSELARWLHRHSSRASESMLELNCGGFTREFLETELFGHEKGAFTGAVTAKVGLLEAAHRGTVFLDEIGDMDLQIQPKLLKALEEKRFRRLGDIHDRKVDFRLIAATHQNLEVLVQERLFRADLFYRVSAIQLVMPALAERIEDIPAMIREKIAERSSS